MTASNGITVNSISQVLVHDIQKATEGEGIARRGTDSHVTDLVLPLSRRSMRVEGFFHMVVTIHTVALPKGLSKKCFKRLRQLETSTLAPMQ